MDLNRAEWHLQNWAEYMQHGTVGKGYPAKCVVISHAGRIHTFEDLESEVDSECAIVADRIIHDLPKQFNCAIHSLYLGSVYRFPGDPPFDEAIEQFWEKAIISGLI